MFTKQQYELEEAVYVNDISLVKEILKTNIDTSAGQHHFLSLACKKGHIEIINLLMSHNSFDKNRDMAYPVVVAATHNQIKTLIFLINSRTFNPSGHDNLAIKKCYENKAFESLFVLFKNKDVNQKLQEEDKELFETLNHLCNTSKQEKFHKAIQEKNIEVFKLLLENKNVDPAFADNDPILLACESGNTEIVKKLLTYKNVDPSVAQNYCIWRASYHGYLDIVKVLLQDPRVDPSDRSNYALHSAYKSKFYDITQLLFKHKKVKALLKDKNISFYNYLMKKELDSKIEEF